jgi:AcrR family transcriptional regulator
VPATRQEFKKSRLKGTERQEQIIQAAVEVFSQYGFRGATVRRLAHRAGVSEAMIYYYFPSKEALYDAILQKKIDASRHLFFPKQAAGAKKDQKVFETIVKNFLKQQSHDSTFMRMLLFSALERHALAPKFVQGPLQEFYSFLGAYLENRMHDGAFKPMEAQVAARLFMGMVIYFTLLREIFHDPMIQGVDFAELTSNIVDLFRNGIERAKGSADSPHPKIDHNHET